MLVVSQARYNLPLMPALLAGGLAGWVMFARGPRTVDPSRIRGGKLAFWCGARVASPDATDRRSRLSGSPVSSLPAAAQRRDHHLERRRRARGVDRPRQRRLRVTSRRARRIATARRTSTVLPTRALAGFPIDGPTFAILTNGDARSPARSTDATSAPRRRLNGTPTRDVAATNAFDIVDPADQRQRPRRRELPHARASASSPRSPEHVGAPSTTASSPSSTRHDWTVDRDHRPIIGAEELRLRHRTASRSASTPPARQLRAAEAAGTAYDDAARQRLSARTVVTPGAHSLYLSIFDQGDRIVDSAAFVDRLSFAGNGAPVAASPARRPTTPRARGDARRSPASSPEDTTPTLSGSGRRHAGDGRPSVEIYAGGVAGRHAGADADRDAQRRRLGRRDRSARPRHLHRQAEQADTAGNAGHSAPATFTVAAPQQQVEAEAAQSPVPGAREDRRGRPGRARAPS